MRKLLETFFLYYLGERNMERALALLTDEVISIGTGKQEVARGKEELRKLMQQEYTEMPEPLKYELYDYQEMMAGADVCNIFANVVTTMTTAGVAAEMRSRLTCTCVKIENEWKIVCLHMSTPEQEQEEEQFFPLQYGTNTVGRMSLDSGAKMMELISDALPGGIMGGYLEEGLPLYTIIGKMLDILGYSYEELISVTDEKMINIIYEADREKVEAGIKQQFQDKNEYEIEYRVIGKDNRLIWVNDVGRKIVTEDGREAMISIMTDITERIKWETQLINEAEHDALTGLYNRKKAASLIEEKFAQNEKGNLFICDVDNFKSINDTKGHIAGDRALMELASIIRKTAGNCSVTARLGGDEYMLFFPGNVEQEQAKTLIRQIQQEFLDTMQRENPDLAISLSVGGTEREEQEDFETLYRKADTALYQAKQKKGDLKMFTVL